MSFLFQKSYNNFLDCFMVMDDSINYLLGELSTPIASTAIFINFDI